MSEVNAAARELIEGVFPPLWVHGEVTNFTKARSGHCYFSLRDADAQLRCVMWRDEARRLPTQPAEGMQVRALGRLTLYEQRGEFQLSGRGAGGQGRGAVEARVRPAAGEAGSGGAHGARAASGRSRRTPRAWGSSPRRPARRCATSSP